MQKLLQVLFVTLLVFLLAGKKPLAWENSWSQMTEFSHACIPHNDAKIRKSPWYIKPHKRLNDHTISLAKLAKLCDHYSQINHGFYDLKKATALIQKECSEALLDVNFPKNRHKKLLPYDQTRSCKELDGFYINASDVHTPVQSYLVTQGPLEHTISDFWQAILHKDSRVIVTLCMPTEEGQDKCANFWHFSTINCGQWTITPGKEYTQATCPFIDSHRLVIRTFVARSAKEARTIYQVHYENWPDGKTPDLGLFIKLLDTVDSLSSNTRRPITVHCSAGIGRSGTFVAAHSLRKELRQVNAQKFVRLNIPKAIFYLRCQRIGLVGTSKQYQTVCQALAKEHKPRNHPFFIL